ncbi:MAG: hypothetical protein LC799_15215, partial [Actinobacteria bacterium]|nr:hypothetical protein [Actinomycetota bacterium]
MRTVIRAFALILLSAAVAAQAPAFVPPPDGAVLDGVPAIPAAIGAAMAPYADFESATFAAWHPTERAMLVRTRFGLTSQLHHVAAPGQAPQPVTRFDDQVPREAGAAYQPGGGNTFLFRKDAKGNRVYQIYRAGPDHGGPTMITDGASRHGAFMWSRTGDRIAFDSTKRNGRDGDIYVVDPSDPSTIRRVAELEGSWSVLAWSPDDSWLLVQQFFSNADQRLWRLDVATGQKTPMTRRDPNVPVLYTSASVTPDGRAVFVIT